MFAKSDFLVNAFIYHRRLFYNVGFVQPGGDGLGKAVPLLKGSI